MIHEIMAAVAATDAKKEKEKILADNKDNELLRNIFYVAYSKRHTFGVTKKSIGAEPDSLIDGLTLHDAINELMERFARRKISGNTAIERVTKLFWSLDHNTRQVFRSIVGRDLEIGASIATANKIWPGLIPEQPQYLAVPYNEKNVAKIKFPAYCDLKADGSRGMALTDVMQVVTRAGSEYQGITTIMSQLEKIKAVFGDVMIDGEVVYRPKSIAPVQKVAFTIDSLFDDEPTPAAPVEQASIIEIEEDRTVNNGMVNKALNGTLSPEEESGLVFMIWDIVPIDVYWGRAKSVETYTERRDKLQQIREMALPNIEVIESQVVNSLDEVLEIYRRYVDMEREGVILKNMHGVWENKRSENQVKFKEEKEIDLCIVDVYPHRKDPNKVGGFTVRSACGRIQCNVGSGLKDTDYEKVNGKKVYIPLDKRHELDRELLMYQHENDDSIEGAILQILCNGIVRRKNRKPHEAEFKLFLPRVQLFRRDKTDANRLIDVFPEPNKE